MRSNLAGPRLLLRRLREVMAEQITAQERLDKIAVLIASNVVAEVCSVYILRADGVLELYATEGLNRSAVHNASLRVGQGLVGLIAAEARPLNLPNASAHPGFAYLPETGEEAYNSFLGVPILRAGRTLGVLVVQNQSHRTYLEDEVEALQTTAMVIAEMVAAGELEAIAQKDTGLDLSRPITALGAGLAEGVGLGHVVLHEPRVVVTNRIAEDTETEKGRLDGAINRLRLSIDDLLASGEIAATGEHREVLEAYRMFAYDRGWIRKIEEAIRNGLTAEAAVEKVQSDTRARMLRQTDPYLRERLHDLDDLAHRLIRELMGREHGPGMDELPQDAIIVGRNMGAAELLDYGRDRIRVWFWKRAGRPVMSPSLPAPLAFRRSVWWKISSAWRMAGTPSLSMVTQAKSICVRHLTLKMPMPKRSGSGPVGRRNTGACAANVGHKGWRRVLSANECRIAG